MNNQTGRVYSVAQINAYIRNMFDQDYLLTRVSVKGEISNCKYSQLGHVFFTLKDAGAAISCVLFAGKSRNVPMRLSDGMKIIATGNVSVYEKSGTYQLNVSSVSAAGLGELYERFEALKKELMEMGMFDPMYKQPIPKHVRKLGVVTAPTGAAVRDIIQIAKRRNPGIAIFLYPALVQGEGAVGSIIRGIRTLDEAGVDVIIIGRGGGSIEDLWAFNEEAVARAVFDARTPIISAVGHETDTVITDFVADLRAPTPSAGAELAVEDLAATMEVLAGFRDRLGREMNERIRLEKSALQMRRLALAAASPGTLFRQNRMRLESLRKELNLGMQRKLEQYALELTSLESALANAMQRKLEQTRHTLQVQAQRLEGASPYRVLSAGYALLTDEQGRRVVSVGETAVGEKMQVYLRDGQLGVQVNSREELGAESGV